MRIIATEARGKDLKPGPKGKAGAVAWHITLPSDAVLIAIDAAGYVVTCTDCLVPPPPK